MEVNTKNNKLETKVRPIFKFAPTFDQLDHRHELVSEFQCGRSISIPHLSCLQQQLKSCHETCQRTCHWKRLDAIHCAQQLQPPHTGQYVQKLHFIS